MSKIGSISPVSLYETVEGSQNSQSMSQRKEKHLGYIRKEHLDNQTEPLRICLNTKGSIFHTMFAHCNNPQKCAFLWLVEKLNWDPPTSAEERAACAILCSIKLEIFSQPPPPKRVVHQTYKAAIALVGHRNLSNPPRTQKLFEKMNNIPGFSEQKTGRSNGCNKFLGKTGSICPNL